MKVYIFLTFCLVVLTSTARADELVTIGKDAMLLDQDAHLRLNGRTIRLIDGHAHGYDNPELGIVNRLMGQAVHSFEIRQAPHLGNAFALIYHGERFIAIDPSWSDKFADQAARRGMHIAGRPASALVLAHEIGHHQCGHTVGRMRSNPLAMELQADRFAGDRLRHLNFPFATIREIAANIFSDKATRTHPAKPDRIRAIWNGYVNGSECTK